MRRQILYNEDLKLMRRSCPPVVLTHNACVCRLCIIKCMIVVRIRVLIVVRIRGVGSTSNPRGVALPMARAS